MHLLPYESFGEARLGEDEGSVVRRLGEPHDRCRQSITGELEYDYESMIVRFDEQGVVEITARPEIVVLDGVGVSRHDLANHLQEKDPEAKNLHGFVISLKYGVAIDDDSENDGWMSVFARGHWDDVYYKS